MKALSWIFVIIAVVIMLLAAIDLVFNPAFLPYKVINYFHVANSFLLLTICFRLLCNCKEKHNN